MTRLRELSIPCRGLNLSALAWGADDAPRILALHGWMDNAASFAPLAVRLDGFHTLALDFAGHGRSDHRPTSCGAPFTDWVADVVAVTHAVGWDDLALIGHSMGGAVAVMAAAVAPRRIRKLVLVDGFGPLSEPASEVPVRLARALEAERSLRPSPDQPCRSIEEAVAARRRTGQDLTPEAARLLVERGTEPCDDGVRFRHDPRLRLPSRIRLTENQVLAFITAIACPVLAIRPDGGWPVPDADLERRLAAFPDLTRVTVAGGHHVHLTHPDRVAQPIREFLSS